MRLIHQSGVRDCHAIELATLLAVDDSVVWVDIPSGDPDAETVLAHAVVTGLNRRMTHHVATLTTDI